MVTKSMQVLIDHLLNHPAETWSNDDWAVVATAACGYRKAGWHNPSDMMPVIRLMDAVWRAWNGMADANQVLALEILNELVNDLVESSHDFISEMRNGQVIYEDVMRQVDLAEMAFADDNDDEDDYLPFGNQTNIDGNL